MSKVTTPVGLTYVKDFSFPAAQGFSGSAGQSTVRGYMRGGAVKKAPVKKAKGGTTMRDGRDMHSKLYDDGMTMGFKRGGQVKKMGMPESRGPQATMDHGVQPAKKGDNEQQQEAGGTKRLKPGYKKGGGVHSIRGVTSSGGGALANAAITKAKETLRSKKVMKAPEKAGTAASKKGMPKNVHARGGKVNC
ncbi:MAG TPA: hypothetical protein VMW50_09285 [Dehalococcoidia bacterium]|nr:hypothetical protein [Dehalococcoidia bacterium]